MKWEWLYRSHRVNPPQHSCPSKPLNSLLHEPGELCHFIFNKHRPSLSPGFSAVTKSPLPAAQINILNPGSLVGAHVWMNSAWSSPFLAWHPYNPLLYIFSGVLLTSNNKILQFFWCVSYFLLRHNVYKLPWIILRYNSSYWLLWVLKGISTPF